MLKRLREHYQNKKAKRLAAQSAAQGEGKNAAQTLAQNQSSRFNDAVFSWTAPLRQKMQKGPIWMIVVSALIAGLLFYGALTANWFFIIAILTAAVVYLIDHTEPTKEIEIKISDYGIKIGQHGIPFSNIKGFWIIHYGPFFSKLYLTTYQKLMPDIGIELMDQDPAVIREFLTRHIVEWEGKQEGLMDICTRLLRL